MNISTFFGLPEISDGVPLDQDYTNSTYLYLDQLECLDLMSEATRTAILNKLTQAQAQGLPIILDLSSESSSTFNRYSDTLLANLDHEFMTVNVVCVFASEKHSPTFDIGAWPGLIIHGPFLIDWVDDYGDLKRRSDEPITKKFLCFNRIPRDHRVWLMYELHRRNLLESFYISFHGLNGSYGIENKLAMLPVGEIPLARAEQEEINSYVQNMPHYTIDDIDPSVNQAHDVNGPPYHEYNTSLVSLVSETEFFSDSIFFTEKTYKPIVMKHPFIQFNNYGSLMALRDSGFKTFGDCWDESYDNISNNYDRFHAILALIEDISSWSAEKTEAVREQARSICEHNYQHYINNMNSIIVNASNWDHVSKDRQEKWVNIIRYGKQIPLGDYNIE